MGLKNYFVLRAFLTIFWLNLGRSPTICAAEDAPPSSSRTWADKGEGNRPDRTSITKAFDDVMQSILPQIVFTSIVNASAALSNTSTVLVSTQLTPQRVETYLVKTEDLNPRTKSHWKGKFKGLMEKARVDLKKKLSPTKVEKQPWSLFPTRNTPGSPESGNDTANAKMNEFLEKFYQTDPQVTEIGFITPSCPPGLVGGTSSANPSSPGASLTSTQSATAASRGTDPNATCTENPFDSGYNTFTIFAKTSPKADSTSSDPCKMTCACSSNRNRRHPVGSNSIGGNHAPRTKGTLVGIEGRTGGLYGGLGNSLRRY